MPMDIRTALDELQTGGRYAQIATNPQAQFGRGARRYLGAELLPEQTVPENAFRETAIRYRTIVANDGTRYSPTQLKGGELVGEMLVELAESDIKREFTAREYDALLRLLASDASMDAMLQLIGWLDTTVNLALIERNEAAIWQAIVSAKVERRGFNAYAEDVAYPNPAGHRAAAGGTWSSDAYDPFADIYAMAQLLADKGFAVSRIVTSRKVMGILGGNAKVAARTGKLVVSGNAVQIQGDRASLAAINQALAAEDLPPIEVYDLQYRTESGSTRFLPNTVFVLLGLTGRDVSLDLGDEEPLFLPNTMGYLALGRAAGQAGPGRVIRSELHEDKPPRIIGEGWQTSLPVIVEPESITVITGIA